eukprot:1718239-Pleurochrysis_carterae.AAC.1
MDTILPEEQSYSKIPHAHRATQCFSLLRSSLPCACSQLEPDWPVPAAWPAARGLVRTKVAEALTQELQVLEAAAKVMRERKRSGRADQDAAASDCAEELCQCAYQQEAVRPCNRWNEACRGR